LLKGEPPNEDNIHLWRVIPGLFYGLQFSPLQTVVSEWEFWTSCLDDPHISAEQMNALSSSSKPGFVKPVYFNRKWIPLTGGSDHLALDFDPGPNGKLGQVINFGRDEDVKYVIANSFDDFLDWYVNQLESGNFVIKEWTGSGFGHELEIKTPNYNHFLDAVREIFD